MVGDLCFYRSGGKHAPFVQQFTVFVSDLNPTGKHGRPPNQEGSANKPPVCGCVCCEAARFMWCVHFKTSAVCPANSELPVFNVAWRLFCLADLFFLLRVITDACFLTHFRRSSREDKVQQGFLWRRC